MKRKIPHVQMHVFLEASLLFSMSFSYLKNNNARFFFLTKEEEEEEGITIKDHRLFLHNGGTVRCFHQNQARTLYSIKSQPPIHSFHK